MPRRLAVRLIVSLTTIVILVEGALGYLNVRIQEHQILDSMILGADQLSKSITSATWHAMRDDHREAAYEVMQTIALKQGIDRIRIFNKEGRVTFSTAGGSGTQVDKRAEACFLCHAEAQPLVKVDVPSRARIFRGADGFRRLGMVTPIYNERACSEAPCHAHPTAKSVLGVVDVTLKLDRVDAELSGIRFRMVLVVGVEILLIGLFIVFFTRRFVGVPIGRLIEGIKAVSNMDLDRSVRVRSKGELGELARSYNDMRERLKETVAELNQLTRSLEARVEERTSQLRATQQRLQQNDRLASLGRLSATVAHEINNPLSGVLNLATLMQRILREDGIPPERLEEFRGYLAQVVRETARAGRIVTDLLSFSRQPRPRPAPVDLNGLIRDTLGLLAHRLEVCGARPRLELAQDLPPASGDASQLQQVVTNLVANAMEAMPQGGDLTVRTGKAPGAGMLFLEVQDAGAGIPDEILHRIFDPFFTTKAESRSVGLGLAVTYGIVEAHGGDIEVKSRVGEGTTFRITLPVLGAGEGGEAGPAGQETPGMRGAP